MTVAGILDQSFRLYRENAVRFIAIVAVIMVPVGLLLAVLMSLFMFGVLATGQGDKTAATFMIAGAAGLLVYIVLMLVGQQLATAALTKSVSETYLGGDVSVGEAYRFVLPKLATLIVAVLCVVLIVCLGYVLCIVPGVIFSLWYVMTVPAIVVENRRVLEGMTRSKQLARGNLGRIFLVLFVVGLISFIVSRLFVWSGALIGALVLAGNPAANVFLQQVSQIIAQVIVMPLSCAATVLLYYDLRIRKEGFDLEMLARSMGSGGAAAGNAE
jgi:hypothetical protein